jgi:hypothetical protein
VYPSTTWVKLKRQITVAGHVLVKEYKDDGHTRTLLDRPALNQLRADLKTCAVAYNCIYCCVCLRRLLCRFSDAGMPRPSSRSESRRPKSAKAGNRGMWGTDGAAGAMGI